MGRATVSYINRKLRQIDNGRFTTERNKYPHGAFGDVVFAKDSLTNKNVALKIFKTDDEDYKDLGIPEYFLREVVAYRALPKHENIIELFEIFTEPMCMSFELLDCNLKQFMRCNDVTSGMKHSFKLQMTSGLAWCHENRIIHRDLKPQNMVVRGETLKLCDFGVARIFVPNFRRSMTLQVTTVWYKAIEMFLGNDQYDEKIDIWALGCVFHELDTNSPLFPGECECHSIFLIYSTLGNPDKDSDLTIYPYYNADMSYGKKDIILDPLVSQMLEYDTKKRPSCEQVQQQLQDLSCDSSCDSKSDMGAVNSCKMVDV
jgi:serine/threonine protein kinase